MADKPSRALVIYADGFVPLVTPSHLHLHSLASRGSCGFLAVRDSKKTESEDERSLRELGQLLDAHDFYVSGIEEHAKVDTCSDVKADVQIPSVSERFMGMRTAIISTCPNVKHFGGCLGFNIIDFDQLPANNQTSDKPGNLPDALAVAKELLKILGFLGGKVLEAPQFDLVFMHLKAVENAKEQLDWLNAMVGCILQNAQTGSGIASRLHFSLVMGYGAITESDNECSLLLISKNEIKSNLTAVFPRQSYTMKGSDFLNNIRHHHPMLVVQWQDAVTRKDAVGAFTFQEFAEHGASNTILADRFLHEVAFKLWKAPKYGA